jgi:hypothetical protein
MIMVCGTCRIATVQLRKKYLELLTPSELSSALGDLRCICPGWSWMLRSHEFRQMTPGRRLARGEKKQEMSSDGVMFFVGPPRSMTPHFHSLTDSREPDRKSSNAVRGSPVHPAGDV